MKTYKIYKVSARYKGEGRVCTYLPYKNEALIEKKRLEQKGDVIGPVWIDETELPRSKRNLCRWINLNS